MRSYLLDKSALAPQLGAEARQRIDGLRSAGRVVLCQVTVLEVLYSARNGQDWQNGLTQLSQDAVADTGPAAWARAVQVQGLLARRGQHRAPSIPDLLVAATAEIESLIVLHNDKDFELIAAVTGQPVERI